MDAVNLPVLYVLLPLLLLSAALSLSDEPRNPEVVVLIGIRQSLNDPRGVLNNWDEYSVDPCSWAMITCSPENLVIGLGAPSQSLSGSLSAAIGNLTNLRQVLLQNNDISGKIPPELGTLPKLQTLDLSNNAFSGSVPHSLGLLDSLQYLRLNNNSLSGAIPASLARIPHLAFLDLSFNSFTPPVPEFAARTFNVAGNPRICGSSSSATEGCSGSNSPVSPSSPRPTAGKPSGAKIAAAMGTSLGVVCLLLLAVGFHLWQRKQQWQQYILNITDKEEEGLLRLGNLRVFTVRELQAATDHFSPKNLIGSGGFGDVYRGCLGDGTAVAVKRLKDLSGASGESQFRTELEMISLAVHRHLLRLIGYCVSPRERILVYPYMANGSVATRLRGRPALEWGERKRVAVGAARGLAYLHEQCDPKIIHRDVKPANVLLDGDCEAVVGDFGLAKLLDHGESHVTTAVRGTVGHIAPEYLSTGRSSEKTDVFGFGILLLELLSGMRTAPDAGKTASRNGAVLEQAKKVHRERKVEVLVDGELGGEYDRIEAGEMLQVAVLCTQNLPARRPRMSEVVRMLEGDGLAEKWAATHGEDDDFRIEPTGAAAGCDGGGVGDPPSGLGATMDGGEEVGEDEESLESFPMELSGPR